MSFRRSVTWEGQTVRERGGDGGAGLVTPRSARSWCAPLATTHMSLMGGDIGDEAALRGGVVREV